MSYTQGVNYIEPKDSATARPEIDQGSVDNRFLVTGDMQELKGSELGTQVYYARKCVGVTIRKGRITPVFNSGTNRSLGATQDAFLDVIPLPNNHYQLDISIPKGRMDTFPSLSIGTVSTVPAGSPATASIKIIAPDTFIMDLGLPEGAIGTIGPVGPVGPFGLPPTIIAGIVTKLPKGSQATVNIRPIGPDTYAVDLGIPTGDDGQSPVFTHSVTYGNDVDSLTVTCTDISGTSSGTLNWDHTGFDPTAVFNASI